MTDGRTSEKIADSGRECAERQPGRKRRRNKSGRARGVRTDTKLRSAGICLKVDRGKSRQTSNLTVRQNFQSEWRSGVGITPISPVLRSPFVSPFFSNPQITIRSRKRRGGGGARGEGNFCADVMDRPRGGLSVGALIKFVCDRGIFVALAIEYYRLE